MQQVAGAGAEDATAGSVSSLHFWASMKGGGALRVGTCKGGQVSFTAGSHHASDCRASAGTFDTSWENLGPYLSSMWLEGSTLHGQLPAAWSQAWSHLTALYLANASLQSSLPPQWGMGGGFPKLGNIHLENNPSLFGEMAQPVRTRLVCMLHLLHRAATALSKHCMDASLMSTPVSGRSIVCGPI